MLTWNIDKFRKFGGIRKLIQPTGCDETEMMLLMFKTIRATLIYVPDSELNV